MTQLIIFYSSYKEATCIYLSRVLVHSSLFPKKLLVHSSVGACAFLIIPKCRNYIYLSKLLLLHTIVTFSSIVYNNLLVPCAYQQCSVLHLIL